MTAPSFTIVPGPIMECSTTAFPMLALEATADRVICFSPSRSLAMTSRLEKGSLPRPGKALNFS